MGLPHRIMVIGGPGAGKSTLARRLGARTGLPVVHLDRLHFHTGWQAVSRETMQAAATAAAQEDRWILDGNYAQTWPYRVRRADLIVFLDLPRALRMRRLAWRLIRYGGRPRPDLGPGLPERYDPAVWHAAQAYDQDDRPAALALIKAAHARGAPRCMILRSPQAVKWFLSTYPKSLTGAASPLRTARR